MKSDRVVVRFAEDGDREAVKQVLVAAYSQYEATLSPERWAQYKTNILEAVEAATTKARLVAELGGEVAGSVFIYDNSEAAYGAPQLEIHNPIIRLLAVLPSARGHGIATELIRASARLSREWGEHTLHLHTSDMMDSAIRLYERLGFERAYDKEFHNGTALVKSYRLNLAEAALLHA
ncbi:GNAT family N-acetyltransferase [Cohnella terricola]|uniref:GNAT family N-acetyltransferase n=1 Tax=Cohnella terricola TaxID=1289167 RepID=A0A559J985_9BACL|nr:GNAT family N-acetyltransferase [Cohnella terricola]TVX96440.1 GNAT family N-acetyltransferase [Cohnella terricola]